MAIVKSMWMMNTVKKLGNTVLYQAMGQTRQRELAATVSNPRTQSQMAQRTRWANLVNFYRANANWMKFAYETKKTNQSEYNKFMSLNVPNSRIYLPKSLASQGACIVDAYQMTQGSLPSIEVLKNQTGWQTNIYVTNAEELDENATIGEVTQVILPANPGMREGDQLSFIRFTQMTNASTGVPFVIVRKYEVILKANDTRRFYDFMPYDYIGWGGSGTDQHIDVTDSGNAGGFLLVLSRTIGGKTYVSTQSIIVANNDALIGAYSSDSAKQTAIDSYGESVEPFLTSSTANEDAQAATMPSVVKVNILGRDAIPGQRFSFEFEQGDPSIVADLTMSQAMVGSVVEVASLRYYQGGVLKTAEFDSAGSSVSGTSVGLPFSGDDGPAVLYDISFELGDTAYRAVFAVTNADTIGGLE